MSLLLDALKKAADDKVQNSNAKKQNKNRDKTQTTNAMELNLDLNPNDPENYPQVNDDVIVNKSAQTDNIKFDISEQLYSKDNQISDNTVDAKSDDSAHESDSEPDNEKELSLEAIDNELASDSTNHSGINKTNVNNNAFAKKQSHQPSEKSTTSRIESEQALSALINKSNQHSRREKLKLNISLGILITLVLIISGMYFYIEMQSTSQNFNLSNNANTPDTNIIQSQTSSAPISKSIANVKSPTTLSTPITKDIRNINKQIKSSPAKQRTINAPQKKTPQTAKPINIIYSKKVDPIHLLLSDAYVAFHAAEYRRSENLYKQAIDREPKNRDALLGLSAIAIKEKRYEYARQKYHYLLRLNPTDSFAIAGLSGIEKHLDSQLSESQLKFMLRQKPDAAHLYFALGSQYSSQLKWAEAQSAYFSAWSADNKNADYCYNLAVSLDHLGKSKQALTFYNLSLKLKPTSNGNFSQADTEKRIQILQANVK